MRIIGQDNIHFVPSGTIFMITELIYVIENYMVIDKSFVVKVLVKSVAKLTGDEIAVYDGDRCVGIDLLRQELSHNIPLRLIAMGDDGSGSGFIEGHPMRFKMWHQCKDKELTEESLYYLDSQTGEEIAASLFEGLATAVVAIDHQGTSNESANVMPEDYCLYQNYPNPFNPVTQINYDLPGEADVMLAIYDVTGNEVKVLFHGRQAGGHYELEWDGTNAMGQAVSSGVSLYKMSTREYFEIKKMMLVK